MYRFAGNLARLITSATPPYMPTLVVVTQREWSGRMREISHLYFFSFLLSSSRPQVAFLNQSLRFKRQTTTFRV